MPEPGERWALFLDFDGTLAELAEHPDAVAVDAGLVPLLGTLDERLDGAIALISGRRIESLDAMLAPARPAAAGLHGLERRARAGGAPARTAGGGLDAAKRALERFVAANPGLLLEDKGGALALHYRGAPTLEQHCRDEAAHVAGTLPGHHVLHGKMVVEVKPEAANKGRAIAEFLDLPAFRGRTPVFAGDDRTDEDGFAWVNANGGISIKVGDGPSAARHRVADVPALHRWLERVAERLDAPTR